MTRTRGEWRMNDFQRGSICAIACIVKGHGADTATDEALRGLGYINWLKMERYDREVFEEAGVREANHGVEN